jgi:hypothetical protein
MTTAIVSTDPIFGPWNIPARGQNMIMNFYAQSKGLKVDTIIPEPLFSKALSTTRWVKKNKSLDRVILCSIHQLDLTKKEELIPDLSDLEVYFCLEDLSGKGEAFLRGIFREIEVFKESRTIGYESVSSFQDLQNILQNGP